MKRFLAITLFLIGGFAISEYVMPVYAENELSKTTLVNVSNFSDRDIAGTEWDYPNGIFRFHFTYPDGGTIDSIVWEDSSNISHFMAIASYLNGGTITGTIDKNGVMHFDPSK